MENRLAKEKSPYLLQHASNPVDWYPWGEEAFAAAKREDKPIFLSIGYATCHWCHVMEKESFSDPNIAQMMNDIFICIKVDREELPHIDNLYMDFAQALLSSSGGWPLNVILTPDLKPFFAITYLPAHPRKGLIGLDQFIQHIRELWKGEEREQLVEQADHLVSIFKESFVGKGEELPSEHDLEQSMQMFFELTDPINGGMKGEPKFPLSYLSDLLLSYGKKQNDSRAVFYVERSLQKMRSGGIYDHLGGGFSRYAVDAAWRVPHFEKMLCDNAILAKTYLQAWKFTAEPFYKEVSSEILEYLLRDMQEDEGGFCSAEDADSEGKEGFFYTWTFSEIAAILSPEELEIFCAYYHVTLEGNFEGRNILYSTYLLKDFAQKAGMTEEALSDTLLECRKKLLTKRGERTPPFKDDKRITAWNALMIDTLIHSAAAMEKEEYRKAALDCANFIFSHLYKDGHLLRRYREKEARFSGTLDDYAFLIKALLSLFECGEGTRFLQLAIHFATILEEEFKMQEGGFYFSQDETHLVFQKCEFYDGAEPSGNGVHAENLLRLYQITQEEKYLVQAEDIFRAVKPYIEAYPPGCGYHLLALQRYLDQKSAVVIIALNEKEEGKETLSRLFYKNFFPSLSLIWKTVKDADLVSLISGLEDKVPIQGKTAVYICRQDGCAAPLTDLAEIEKAIHRL